MDERSSRVPRREHDLVLVGAYHQEPFDVLYVADVPVVVESDQCRPVREPCVDKVLRCADFEYVERQQVPRAECSGLSEFGKVPRFVMRVDRRS